MRARFRRHRQHAKFHMRPWYVVGICLVGAVALTLAVGNLLAFLLDDEDYRKYTEGEPELIPPSIEYDAPVKQINAYPFVLGEEIDRVLGIPAVSVALNKPDGTLTYSSDVAQYLGLVQVEQTPLMDTVSELSAYIPYVSGTFYPQALSQPTMDLVYTAAAEEAALLREFLHVGGNEVLLRDLPLSLENVDRVTLYLQTIKAANPKHPIGVAVPLSVARSEHGWEILASLLQACDFCALDLTMEEIEVEEETETGEDAALLSAQTMLTEVSYYLTQYDMRVLISEEQEALLLALELQMCPDYQVVAKIDQ